MDSVLTPCFPHGFERPCAEEDFEPHRHKATLLVQEFLHLTDTSKENLLRNKENLINLLSILGENHARFPWNNEEIVRCCRHLLAKLFGDSNPSIPTILGDGLKFGNNQEIRPLLKPLVLSLRPKLLSKTWKKYPAAVECFSWILHQAKLNQLSDIISLVLPTALLLVDDFENENRIIGVKCLARIFKDMTIAELKFHGYGQVMYKALETLLREKDAAVARCVIPCIFDLVARLETDLGDTQHVAQWSRFDDIMDIILGVMEIEQQLSLREFYILFLPKLIGSLGGRIYRWVKRLLTILESYLETSASLGDRKNVKAALLALESLLLATPDTSSFSRPIVLEILLRQTYYCAKLKEGNSDVMCLIRSCLGTVLAGSSPEELSYITSNLRKSLNGIVLGEKVCELLFTPA